MLLPGGVQVGIESWMTASTGLFAEVFLGVEENYIKPRRVRLYPTHARIASDLLVSQFVVYEGSVAVKFLAELRQIRQVPADAFEVLFERVIRVE